MIDNSALIAPFCPATADGDTFIYTEMLDRGKRKGNNGHRLLKAFYHRSVEEFWAQWPTIKQLCDMVQVRACTRLAPRSYQSVGKVLTTMTVEAALSANWAGMKSLYNRACGIAGPNRRLWLFDVDEITDVTRAIAAEMDILGVLRARIPSKKGEHLITVPFHIERLAARPILGKDGTMPTYGAMQLHRDNPTNLYIPDGAA